MLASTRVLVAVFVLTRPQQNHHTTPPLLQGANAVEVVWLVVVLTVLLVAARAAFVVPFALLHNCWSAPADRLSRRDVVIVWWAGLMRGACVCVAY